MKRILALLAALLLAAPAGAQQQIRSDQIKLKTNGGLGGDSSRSLGIEVYRGTSGPASPETGAFWCDTNSTPCTLKMYDGDSWEAVSPSANITTAADFSSPPGSPSDGQLLYVRSCRCLYVYDATGGYWVRQDVSSYRPTAGADLSDEFSSTVITAPSGAPTVTAASGGSGTAGQHTCAYTYVNSTGGETTLSPTTTVTLGSPNFTYSWSNVSAGGTGTTERRLYCSAAGTTTPLYWQGRIGDNTTTTANVTIADGSFRNLAPATNYSGALNAAWTLVEGDSSYTGSGGCGSTGTSMICVQNRRANVAPSTSDPVLRLYRDISTYQNVEYEVDYRVLNIGTSAGVWGTFVNTTGLCGLKNGSTSGSNQWVVTQNYNSPQTSTNTTTLSGWFRVAPSGALQGINNIVVPPPSATWVPYTVKLWSSGAPNYRAQAYASYGSEWGVGNNGLTASVTGYGMAPFSASYPPSSFECQIGGSSGSGLAIEIDDWTLTQQ